MPLLTVSKSGFQELRGQELACQEFYEHKDPPLGIFQSCLSRTIKTSPEANQLLTQMFAVVRAMVADGKAFCFPPCKRFIFPQSTNY